jgi:hypothetical protein
LVCRARAKLNAALSAPSVVRNQSPAIDVSEGIVPFLRDMGMLISNRNYKNQMTCLA